jgi:hypothetical protein
MRATRAASEGRSKEVRMGFFARAENPANKAPEPTPGPVTSRAVLVSEVVSSRKARLAPGPVVAHL